jgi:hypothetical protein
MWTRPREGVAAAIAQNRDVETHLLAAASGMLSTFSNLTDSDLGAGNPLWLIVMLWLPLGAVGGLISLYIASFVFKLTGRWLGGTAHSEDVRFAVGWSVVPTLPTFVPLLGLVAVAGTTLFDQQAELGGGVLGALLLFAYIFVAVVCGIWGLVTFMRALAEVHQFSVWRSIGSIALPFLLLVLVVGGAAVLVALLS